MEGGQISEDILVCEWLLSQDVWLKFKSRKTSFTTFQEKRTKLPTTVLCFEPFVKQSVLKKYNLTEIEVLFMGAGQYNVTWVNISWTELSDELFYKLNRDFFYLYGGNDVWIENFENNTNIQVSLEPIVTFFSGLCYKISLNYFNHDEWMYNIIYWNTVAKGIKLNYLYFTKRYQVVYHIVKIQKC